MAVTSGFFNSLNGDRKYSADQFGSIFSGVITDGVFLGVGNVFTVSANSGMTLNVASGRAWFNNTWIYNDGTITVTLDASEPVLNRIDAVVIEINKSEISRANTIKVVKGSPASSPSNPTLTNTAYIKQYPLAYIYVEAKATTIAGSAITNAVGTTTCPYVTSVLQSMTIDNITAQMNARFQDFLTEERSNLEEWTEEQEADFETWEATQKTSFDNWLSTLKNELTSNQAANLANAISNCEKKPTYTTITMSANSWANSLYSFEASYPSSTYSLDVTISKNATYEQVSAYINAMLIGDTQYNKVYAKGLVPKIDIPVTVGVRRLF